MPDKIPDRMPEDMPEYKPEDMPDRMPKNMPEDVPEYISKDIPDRMPDRMPEDMSDRMPEDLPIRKCINIMMGIIRNKILYIYIMFPFKKNTYNPFLLILNVPRILRTDFHLQFRKISIWPI